MNRSLDALSPRFKPLAMAFLAKLVEADIHVKIIQTLRTPEEHAANLANGRSWTAHSKHLDGDALDVCLYSIWQSHGEDKLNWDSNDRTWQELGRIAESLGLRWGGRWQQKDMGHVEYVHYDPAPTKAA